MTTIDLDADVGEVAPDLDAPVVGMPATTPPRAATP